MSNHFRQRAADLVRQFEAKASIKLSGNDEEALTQMILAALIGEVQNATDKMSTVLTELRRDISKPELGL